MEKTEMLDILRWVSEEGMKGRSEAELLAGFCERCVAAGLPVARAQGIIDTLHPTFEGRAFRWTSQDQAPQAIIEYQSTAGGAARTSWTQSVFHHLLENGQDFMRIRLAGTSKVGFNMLDSLQEQGHTDSISVIHHFTEAGRVGQMDCFYSYWTTYREGGFEDEHIAALRAMLPTLALAVKCAASIYIIRTIANVYLGQDAGERVVNGSINRGSVERIECVIWSSDLHNYTRISDSVAPQEIIPFLNDYADAAITAIQANGGSVLKMIGDGVLAIFSDTDRCAACVAAINAERQLRAELTGLNRRREEQGLPTTDVYLGLHLGEVYYGNIGSDSRLDFTVIGPAVNEVSRISALCTSVGRHVIMSSEFVTACPEHHRSDTVSLGRYALRGVGRAKELFTWDPELMERPDPVET